MTDKNHTIKIGVDCDTEKLEDTVDLVEELATAISDSKPNITIRNNENVHVTINNFNEPEKEWSRED